MASACISHTLYIQPHVLAMKFRIVCFPIMPLPSRDGAIECSIFIQLSENTTLANASLE